MSLPGVTPRLLRAMAVFYAVIMTFVVASGWVPGWYTTAPGGERMSFGLFMLSPLDDITHGLTALVFIAAAITGAARHVRLACTAFGWYYALDAVFFLTYGFVNDKTWLQDVMLNAPHVLLGGMLLWLAYAPLTESAPRPAAARA
jgi:hypothetical protein